METRGRSTLSSMKTPIIAILLFMAGHLSGQRLVWLQQTATGSVVPIIHPKPVIDPCQPSFSSDYEYFVNWNCEDSLFTHLDFHSPKYGNSTENKTQKCCHREIDFAYPFLVYYHHWINNPDLYQFIHIKSGFSWWTEKDLYTRELKSSDHVYVCGNDRTGHTIHEHQIWQLDSNFRVKSITDINEQDNTESHFNFTYTAFGKIKTMSGAQYNPYDSASIEQTQQEWFYDERGRENMMLRYSGPKQNPGTKTLQFLKQELSRQIKKGRSKLPQLIDSLNLETVLVYNYGKFGLEQANCFYNPTEYSIDLNYYSDSIFYNSAGKIVGFKGGINMDGDWSQLWYSYDAATGRLSRVTGREHSAAVDRGADEAKVQQWFSYRNGRVSSLVEKIYEIDYEYKNEKYVNPKERLNEERVYTYRYKIGK